MGAVKLKVLLPWVIAVFALAVGYFVGRSTSESRPGSMAGNRAEQRRLHDLSHGSLPSATAQPGTPGSRVAAKATSAGDAISRVRAIMLETPSFERDQALVQFVSRIPREQLLDVLKSLQGQTDVVRGAMASHLVLERLAAEDTGSALEWLKSRPQGVDGYIGINTLFSVWAGRDLGMALATSAELVDPRQRQQAQTTILSSVAQRDPLKALELLEKDPLLSRNGQGENTVYAAWAAKDPMQAAQSALNVPAGVRRQKAIGGLMDAWAGRDPAAAWAWAKSLTSPQDQLTAFERAAASVSARDPKFVADHLAEIPAGRTRSRTLSSLGWQWAMQDPESAVRWAQGSLNTQESAATIPQIVAGWAQRDPGAAAAFASSITDSKNRDAAMNNLVWSWGQNDPAAAAAFFAGLPENEQRRNYLSNVARQWAGADPNSAFDWAMKLSNPRERSSSLSSVLSAWAEVNPAAAGQSLLALNDPDAKTRAADNLTSTWARTDPNAALQWASRLPEGPSRASAYRGLISSWIEQDEMAATRWLDQLPDGPSREMAVSTYVDRRMSTDPEGAFYWASSLAGERDRRGRMYNAATNWMRRDPAAASQAIMSSSLPEKEKLRLVQRGR